TLRVGLPLDENALAVLCRKRGHHTTTKHPPAGRTTLETGSRRYKVHPPSRLPRHRPRRITTPRHLDRPPRRRPVATSQRHFENSHHSRCRPLSADRRHPVRTLFAKRDAGLPRRDGHHV